MTAVIRWLPKRKGISALAFWVINELTEQRGAVVGGGTVMPGHRPRDTLVGEEEGAADHRKSLPEQFAKNSACVRKAGNSRLHPAALHRYSLRSPSSLRLLSSPWTRVRELNNN